MYLCTTYLLYPRLEMLPPLMWPCLLMLSYVWWSLVRSQTSVDYSPPIRADTLRWREISRKIYVNGGNKDGFFLQTRSVQTVRQGSQSRLTVSFRPASTTFLEFVNWFHVFSFPPDINGMVLGESLPVRSTGDLRSFQNRHEIENQAFLSYTLLNHLVIRVLHTILRLCLDLYDQPIC